MTKLATTTRILNLEIRQELILLRDNFGTACICKML